MHELPSAGMDVSLVPSRQPIATHAAGIPTVYYTKSAGATTSIPSPTNGHVTQTAYPPSSAMKPVAFGRRLSVRNPQSRQVKSRPRSANPGGDHAGAGSDPVPQSRGRLELTLAISRVAV